MGFLEDHIRPQRRASRRCNYLTLDPSRPRCSTTPIWCPAPAWSRSWRWPSSAAWRALADEHLSVPTDKGANAGAEDDLAGRGHGRRRRQHRRHGLAATRGDGHPVRSPVRTVDVGVVPAGIHLRSRPPTRCRRVPVVVAGWHDRTPLLAGIDGPVCVDIDDTIIEVHGTPNKDRDTATPGCAD